MKPTLILAALALTGCSAFTAPKDPVTGIRQDAPHMKTQNDELYFHLKAYYSFN